MITASIELDLEQARVLAKSVSRSLDVEARKMERTRKGTPVYDEAASSYRILDDIDAQLRTAMRSIIDGESA